MRSVLSPGNSIVLGIAAALLFISVTTSCQFWSSFCWNSSTLSTDLFMFVSYARAAGLLSPRTYTLKPMTHGSTSCNICCSTNVELCCTDVLNGIKLISIFVQHRSTTFNVLNGIVHHSTWHDTLFNICWTTAATFVDQQMLYRVWPALNSVSCRK